MSRERLVIKHRNLTAVPVMKESRGPDAPHTANRNREECMTPLLPDTEHSGGRTAGPGRRRTSEVLARRQVGRGAGLASRGKSQDAGVADAEGQRRNSP